jgi:hypothetical protein
MRMVSCKDLKVGNVYDSFTGIYGLVLDCEFDNTLKMTTYKFLGAEGTYFLYFYDTDDLYLQEMEE